MKCFEISLSCILKLILLHDFLNFQFVRALCSTLLLKTGMKLPVPDAEDQGATYDIPKLHGPPLVLVREQCGGYANTHEAVAAILFSVAVYACAIDSKRSEAFWNVCLLKDMFQSSQSRKGVHIVLIVKFLQ